MLHASVGALAAVDITLAHKWLLRPQGTSATPSPSQFTDHEDESFELLRRMHFTPGQAGIRSSTPMIRVVVVEGDSFQKGHAELLRVSAVSSGALIKAAAAHSTTCPEGDTLAFTDPAEAAAADAVEDNHAAAVLGILSAELNHHATVGVFNAAGFIPSFTWLLRANLLDFRNGDPISQFLMTCHGVAGQPVIVNLSAIVSLDDAKEAARQALGDPDSRASQMLVVVAAGNKQQFPSMANVPQQPGCVIYPSCVALTLPHMISVVALGPDGTSVSAGSLSGPVFEVSAIGELNTVGATSDAAVEKSSGTSFAAPYVSALAVLVYSRFHESPNKFTAEVLPMDLKQRIVSTVDFVPALDGKVSYGRINFDRALDLELDRLEYSKAGTPCDGEDVGSSVDTKMPLRGELLTKSKLTLQTGTDVARNSPLSRPLEVDPHDILRIRRNCAANSNSPSFDVVIRVDREELTPGALFHGQTIRYTDVTFGQKYLTEGTIGGAVNIQLSSLSDFTSCMRTIYENRGHCANVVQETKNSQKYAR
jgi:hypothetical protein